MKLTHRIATLFGVIGAFGLLCLLGVMFYGIVARLVFNLTGGDVNWQLSGTRDAARHGLIILVFSCLPFLPQSGLINVELVAEKLPLAIQRLLSAIWLILLCFCAGLGLYQFALKTHSQFMSGETSQDLAIPAYLLSSYLCLCLMALALNCVISLFAKTSRPKKSVA